MFIYFGLILAAVLTAFLELRSKRLMGRSGVDCRSEFFNVLWAFVFSLLSFAFYSNGIMLFPVILVLSFAFVAKGVSGFVSYNRDSMNGKRIDFLPRNRSEDDS